MWDVTKNKRPGMRQQLCAKQWGEGEDGPPEGEDDKAHHSNPAAPRWRHAPPHTGCKLINPDLKIIFLNHL